MLYRKNRKRAAAAVLLLCLMLSACSVTRFESVEEQLQKEEDAAVIAQNNVAVVPEQMQKESLTIQRTLTNSAGAVLAVYDAAIPQFRTDGAKSAVFQRMNSYYGNEMVAYSQDCDSFFNMVKAAYGEEWDTVVPEGAPYTVELVYQLQASPEEYICLQRQYTTAEPDGKRIAYTGADVFFAGNGWQVRFSDLFAAEKLEDAKALALEEIKNWCSAHSVACQSPDTLVIDDFTDHFGVTSTSLVFYTDRFQLSSEDGSSYRIELPLQRFREYLAQR